MTPDPKSALASDAFTDPAQREAIERRVALYVDRLRAMTVDQISPRRDGLFR